MPTNEERREVAGKLLDTTTKLHAHSFSREWEANLEDALGLPVKLTSKDRDCLMAALDRLEDFIEPEPERTCRKVPGRMRYGERKPKCSECGYSLGDPRWFYCPKCGGRIEE